MAKPSHMFQRYLQAWCVHIVYGLGEGNNTHKRYFVVWPAPKTESVMVCTVVFIADLQTCFNGTLYLLIYVTLLSFFPYMKWWTLSTVTVFWLMFFLWFLWPAYSDLLVAECSFYLLCNRLHFSLVRNSLLLQCTFFWSHQQSFDPHQLCCFRLIRLYDTCYFNHILIYKHLLHTIWRFIMVIVVPLEL